MSIILDSHLLESAGPVVPGAASLGGDEDVLRVEEVPVLGGLDTVDHAGLEINEHGTGNVMVVVGLPRRERVGERVRRGERRA